jgi:CRP-like cAMP-binding protein
MGVRWIGRSEVSQMSAMQQPSTETTPDDKEGRLLSYLRERAADGELYFKSKFIADEVGLSPKEIGALMVKLRDSATELEIEKWSYTSATTWRVEPA